MPKPVKPVFQQLHETMRYLRQFINAGGIVENVQNISAHRLYGTQVDKLAAQSKVGIVYNPPGH